MRSSVLTLALGLGWALGWLALVPASLSAADASPLVPGFARFHAQGQEPAAGGQLLLGELNCTSCHQAGEAALTHLRPKPAPVLTGVGTRVRPEYIRQFLLNPHKTRPGTTMPDPFAGWSEAERTEAAEALTHYLALTGIPSEQQIRPAAISKGDDLFHRVGCIACHDPQKDGVSSLATSVPLTHVGAKYTLPGLAAFLQDPCSIRPGARMPSLDLKADEARDIASYLLRDLKDLRVPANLKFAYYRGEFSQLPDFDKLTPTATGETTGFGLGFVPETDFFALRFQGEFSVPRDGQYRFSLGSDDGSRLTIDGKVVINHDGIHGTTYKQGAIPLKAGRHSVQVDFFEAAGGEELHLNIQGPGVGNQPLENLLIVDKPPQSDARPKFTVDAALAEKGKQLFTTVGCASCHQMQGIEPPKPSAPSLAALKASGGCLSEQPVKGAPFFNLSTAQRSALTQAVAAVKQLTAPPTPAEQIATTLKTLNCYACHERGKLGGIEEPRNKFFRTTQQEMGDEGRIPPPLTGVGAKLQHEYLKQFLSSATKERPYMHTRMPHFAGYKFDDFIAAVQQADPVPELAKVEHNFTTAVMKRAGREMVGSKGFSCIKCHTWGNIQATGIQSINMQRMHSRLKQEWFEAYIMNPQAYRPGTRMPSSWPEGQVLLPKLLDGKAPTQIRALWTYLADGEKAPIPLGLGRDPIELIPDKEPIIYRNFIEGAGPRAIGVGYPEKVNLAFDANQLRLALIWQGAFIDASRHWIDRGVGFQPPLGDNVLKLPDGVPLAALTDEAAPWPAQPAKELGYRFLGYRLDDARRPTFIYRYGDIDVADTPVPVVDGEQVGFRRTLAFQSHKPAETIYYRAAVDANIKAGEEGTYQVGECQMRFSGYTGKPVLRSNGGQTELLIPISLTGGKAKIVQEFAW